MNTEQQRQELLKAYPNSERWEKRVKLMEESQVSAIYIRLKNEGKLGK